jgi:hypothetical protein
MSMEEPHAHMRESMESISAFFVYFSLRLVLLLVCSPILALSRHLVPRFPLDPRHLLLQIVVLTQYALVITLRSHTKTS